jgi:hypothetical protein
MEKGKSVGARDVMPARRGEREARVVRTRWHEIFWSIDTMASGELRGEIGNGYRMTLGLNCEGKT